MDGLPKPVSMWPRAVLALCTVGIVAGSGWWWFMGRQSGYYLETSDARGLQSGDPVIRNGVGVGQVVGVEAMDEGARVRLEMSSGETLFFGDLVRIDRRFLSAQATIEVVRPCAAARDPEGGEIPAGRTIEEATRRAVWATQARCSAAVEWLIEALRDVDLDRAVDTFRGTVSGLRSRGEEAWNDGREYLIESGSDLIERLEGGGMMEQADSIRQMVEDSVAPSQPIR